MALSQSTREEKRVSLASEEKRSSKWRFGRDVDVVKILMVEGSSPRVEIMSARTRGVAVAVRVMVGTSG